MELRNLTPYCAHLFRGVLDDDTMVAVAVCRVTCTILEDGDLEPLEVQETVRDNTEELPDGFFDDDGAPLKPGVEVVVLGDAIPVPGPSATGMMVSLRVGEVTREVRVFGERTWKLVGGVDREEAIARSREGKHDTSALVASAPEPFERMPVAWDRAFGGKAVTPSDLEPQGELPYPENAEGRGYHLYLEGALGAALPNLEDPEQPINTWQDRPEPACMAPLSPFCKLCLERGYVADHKTGELDVLPESFLVAPAQQVFKEIAPGTDVEVRGMHPDGSICFAMPDIPVEVEVRVDQDSSRLPCRTDTVEIYPGERKVVLVMRAGFQYGLRDGEERMVLISPAGKTRFRP